MSKDHIYLLTNLNMLIGGFGGIWCKTEVKQTATDTFDQTKSGLYMISCKDRPSIFRLFAHTKVGTI